MLSASSCHLRSLARFARSNAHLSQNATDTKPQAARRVNMKWSALPRP